MPPEAGSSWFVYLLECRNGRLYTGITTDLQRRLREHTLGTGAAFTRRNKPAGLLAAIPCENRSQASKIEYAVKAMRSPAHKRAHAASWPIRFG